MAKRKKRLALPNYILLDDATRTIAKAERLLVVGCSGGGKTTLSKTICANYDLDYLSMDRDVRWLPGWINRDKQEQRSILENLVQRDRWVMDGTGPSTFDIRLPRTDLVLWVRVPRRVSLVGLATRIAKHIGTVRPDMAEGCPERWPDKEFLSYIWNFERVSAPSVIRSLDLHGPDVPVLVLNSRQEIRSFIDKSKR